MDVLKGKRHDVDGTVTDVVISMATYLKDMQAGVGGFIEIVRIPGGREPPRDHDVVMVVNEDGLGQGLQLNPMGCALYGTIEHGQPVVGPVLVFERAAFVAFDDAMADEDVDEDEDSDRGDHE